MSEILKDARSVLAQSQGAPLTTIEPTALALTVAPEPWEFDSRGKYDRESPANIRSALVVRGVRMSCNTFKDVILVERAGVTTALSDAILSDLRIEIRDHCSFLNDKSLFRDVLESTARKSSFHPVRDYLASVEPAWDSTSRIDTWLIDYAGAEDTPLTRAVSRIVLVAAVRRVRQPGCKFDEMLTLEGCQGAGKSSLLKALCPDEKWFTDNLELDENKARQMEATRGRWIVEAPELSGLSRTDKQKFKAFLSRSEDTNRMAFKHYILESDRQFIIIATTNDSAYLDEYENRRVWPIAVGKIDLPGFVAVRDQLWAEAATAETAGESIRLDESLWGAAAIEQAERRTLDPYEIMFAPLLGEVTGRVLVTDMQRVAGFDGDKVPTQQQVAAIGRAMNRLGWTRWRRRAGAGVRLHYYVRGTLAEQAVDITLRGNSVTGWCLGGVHPSTPGQGGHAISNSAGEPYTPN